MDDLSLPFLLLSIGLLVIATLVVVGLLRWFDRR